MLLKHHFPGGGLWKIVRKNYFFGTKLTHMCECVCGLGFKLTFLHPLKYYYYYYYHPPTLPLKIFPPPNAFVLQPYDLFMERKIKYLLLFFIKKISKRREGGWFLLIKYHPLSHPQFVQTYQWWKMKIVRLFWGNWRKSCFNVFFQDIKNKFSPLSHTHTHTWFV